MTYFEKKNFHLSEGPILEFFNTIAEEKDRNTKKIKINAFSKIV
jgi:hypothetical protein